MLGNANEEEGDEDVTMSGSRGKSSPPDDVMSSVSSSAESATSASIAPQPALTCSEFCTCPHLAKFYEEGGVQDLLALQRYSAKGKVCHMCVYVCMCMDQCGQHLRMRLLVYAKHNNHRAMLPVHARNAN